MILNASLFCLVQYTPVSPRVSAMYYYMPLLGIPVLVLVVVVGGGGVLLLLLLSSLFLLFLTM